MSESNVLVQQSVYNPAAGFPLYGRLVRSVVKGLTGWDALVQFPVPSKCVVIGAPHTTGADLFLAWYFKAVTGIQLSWAAKDELFIWPIAWFLRMVGGIPVNRRERTNFVGQMVAQFEKRDVFVFGIVPEGTRGIGSYWKSGFYYIATGANVPLVFGYADYKRKVIGFGPIFMPTGDINADFEHIKAFYSGIPGRYPELQGEIRLKPDESPTESNAE